MPALHATDWQLAGVAQSAGELHCIGGSWHRLSLHQLVMQSLACLHAESMSHAEQLPPQSTSLSSPFCRPSVHDESSSVDESPELELLVVVLVLVLVEVVSIESPVEGSCEESLVDSSEADPPEDALLVVFSSLGEVSELALLSQLPA